jgi:hypothetical protein
LSDFDIRLRRYTPGGAAGPILGTQSIDYAGPYGDVSTLSFEASEATEGTIPDLLEVAVEVFDGNAWAEPKSARFLTLKHSSDGLDTAGIRKVTCVSLAAYLMSKAELKTTGEDRPFATTVGSIILTVLAEARERGWGQFLTTTFTGEADSNGVPWSYDATVDLAFQDGTTLAQILQIFSDQGNVEYATEGRALHLYNPNSGVDYSAGPGKVTLGATAAELPDEASLEDLATHVVIKGEKESWTFAIPGARTDLGRLEVRLSASGVTTEAQAAQFAELYKTTSADARHQYTITEDAAALTAIPTVHYQTGDWASVRRPHGWERMRVTSLQFRKDKENKLTVDVILADRLLDASTRIAKRNAALGARLAGNGRFSQTASGGAGGIGGSNKIGTVASPWGTDGEARVILEGESGITAVGYMANYTPVSYDKVGLLAFGNDGRYIIIDRIVDGPPPPPEPLYPEAYLHRTLRVDANAGIDSSTSIKHGLQYTTPQPDDKGASWSGIKPARRMTVEEAGTYEIEAQLVLNPCTPDFSTSGDAQAWAAMYLLVLYAGGGYESFQEPGDPTNNALSSVGYVTPGQPVTLYYKTTMTFAVGDQFEHYYTGNYFGESGADITPEKSFMKIQRIA